MKVIIKRSHANFCIFGRNSKFQVICQPRLCRNTYTKIQQTLLVGRTTLSLSHQALSCCFGFATIDQCIKVSLNYRQSPLPKLLQATTSCVLLLMYSTFLKIRCSQVPPGVWILLHAVLCDITRFSPQIDWIFPGEALNPFFGAQDKGFSEFHSR